MNTRAGLSFSPLSEKIFWGRISKNGIAMGEQREVTSEFLQIMELKFPINTAQSVSVNGENKYRVIVVDMDKEVIVNGKKV